MRNYPSRRRGTPEIIMRRYERASTVSLRTDP